MAVAMATTTDISLIASNRRILSSSHRVGVQISMYGPIIQELYKQHKKKNDGKGFTLHHCYKEPANNEKWVRRNF